MPAAIQKVIEPRARLLWVLVFAGEAFVLARLTGLAVISSYLARGW